jgi:hypothetical protein
VIFENKNPTSIAKKSSVYLLPNYENSFADRPENCKLLEYKFRLTNAKSTTGYSRWIHPVPFAVSKRFATKSV